MMSQVFVITVALLSVLFVGNLMFGYHTFQSAMSGAPEGTTMLMGVQPKVPEVNPIYLKHKGDVGRFKDPKLAYRLLQLVNPDRPGDYNKKMDKPEFGLKRNPAYCKKSLEYMVNHQDEMFDRINYIAEFDHESIPRSWVLRTLGGYDVMPEVSQSMPSTLRHKRKYDLRPNVNWFYFMKRLHVLQLIGKEIICDHQLYNHLVGAKELTHKDKVAGHFQKYQDQYVDQPQCIQKFMPSSYLLDDKAQCQDFFRYLKTKEYKERVKKVNIVFIWKIGEGVHGGKGVLPFDRKLEADLVQKYEDGAKCGTLKETIVMQQYVNNPLLLHGRKFDFRMYLLVVSTNPLIAYYHDGYMRISLANYDKNSEDLFAHLTNAHVSEQAMEEAKAKGTWRGKTYEELTAMQYGDFYDLGRFLVETGQIPSMQWIETDLRPKLRKAMIHLLRSTQWAFANRSNTYEIFGVDLLVDDNLDVWFMECNANPAMKRAHPPYPPKEAFIADMLHDHFELMFGYWRSRMKRIVNYINKLTDELDVDADSFHPTEKWIQTKKAEFAEVNKNVLDPEFAPPHTNQFFKIVDDNLEGTARYSNLLPQECL